MSEGREGTPGSSRSSLPSVHERDFAHGGSEELTVQHAEAVVTAPDAYHPQSKTRHDDHITRTFIGPHLILTTSAKVPHHHLSRAHLAKRRQEAAHLWRHAVRRGADGRVKGKVDDDIVEWRGGTFTVGEDVRSAFHESLDAEERANMEAEKLKRPPRRRSAPPRAQVTDVDVDSPDDMLKLLSHEETRGLPTSQGDTLRQASSMSRPSYISALSKGPQRAKTDTFLLQTLDSDGRASGESMAAVPRDSSAPNQRGAADPTEVLSRSKAPNSALKRSTTAPSEGAFRSDRMLLKQGWSPRESLPHPFDALRQRECPVRFIRWEEHLVEYKKGKIEIWGRSHGFGPHRWSGDLKLRHVIPLHTDKVKLSIYNHSEPILTFTISHACLTAAAARRRLNKHALQDHLKAQGTTVFLLRPLLPTLASDWVFDIWKELGGQIPSHLFVSVPDIDARLVIPVPEDASHAASEWDSAQPVSGAGYKLLMPDKVVQNCTAMVDRVGDWHQLHVQRGGQDLELALAWRSDNIIDWLVDKTTLKGKPRDTAVLAGYAVQQCSRPHHGGLEMRAATHYPDSAKLKSGRSTPEPCAIEGYLTRIFGAGFIRRERLYISTQSGHLFVTAPIDAHPPEAPIPAETAAKIPPKERLEVLGESYKHVQDIVIREGKRKRIVKVMRQMVAVGPADSESTDEPADLAKMSPSELRQEVIKRFVDFEKIRACLIAETARGYLDLRSIKAIRPLEPESDRRRRHAHKEDAEETEVEAQDETPEDDDDTPDHGPRIARTFELELENGRVVRFEARSEVDALEWRRHLTDLSTYWQARSRADAVEQMLTEPQTAFRARSVFRNEAVGEAPPRDPFDSIPDPVAYSRAFDFCSIRGCRGILRFGRLFVTKGNARRSKERWIALVRGALLSFKIDRHRPFSGASVPTDFHTRSARYPLNGCYLITGHICLKHLSKSGERPFEGLREGRVFHDGLISYDEEADTIFELMTGHDTKERLGQRGTKTIFRARSMLERDAWAACISRELERLHREAGGQSS